MVFVQSFLSEDRRAVKVSGYGFLKIKILSSVKALRGTRRGTTRVLIFSSKYALFSKIIEKIRQ